MFRIFSKLTVRLSLIILLIMTVLFSTFIYMQTESTKIASEQTIGSLNMKVAEAYATQFDVEGYEQFLQQPEETELYWKLREELNQFRLEIGALYVYTVQIDQNNIPLLLIDGQPQQSEVASPIGEVTDIPAAAIEQLWNGSSAKSDVIVNPEYGSYISSYAPIHNASGTLIGVLGIDTDVSVSTTIYEQLISNLTSTFIILGAITFIVFLIIALFLFRSLRRLGILVNGAQSIADGDIAKANQVLGTIRKHSKDEIGQVYEAMVKMSAKLGVMLGDVARDMKATTEQLVHSTNQFTVEADNLLHMNSNLAESASELALEAEQQHTGAEECASSMQEITSAITRVSDSSATVSGASHEALQSAEQGVSSIASMQEQVKQMSQLVQHTSSSVHLLNDYMSQIEPVLHAITSIADQTKLLALNASIEAARAGEHGKGFAVVANEVHKLAISASSSTSHAVELLSKIGEESARIGERMAEESKEIEISQTLSSQVKALFEQTASRFHVVNLHIEEISAATEELLASSQEVAASVEQISQISKTTAAHATSFQQMSLQQLEAVRTIASTTELLKNSSDRLDATVKQFKL